MYLYIKALHIIFIVNWFAGLFYMPRLFIYTTEANEKEEPARSILIEQNKLMQQRLWFIITWPAAVITLVLGVWLLVKSGMISQPWMHVKLTFVVGLYAYHIACHFIYLQQQKNIFKYTSRQLRIWNEGATIFLFAIIFLVVIKTNLSFVYGLVGMIALAVLLMAGIQLYAIFRSRD
jgi:putative membrane protein